MPNSPEMEIKHLESQLAFSLPIEYRNFLLKYGVKSRTPLLGTDCLIEHIKENNDYLPSLLAENGVDHDLSANYVCFLVHQGYIAAWFNLEPEAENPICWYYSESEGRKPRVVGPFSEFINVLMQEWSK